MRGRKWRDGGRGRGVRKSEASRQGGDGSREGSRDGLTGVRQEREGSMGVRGRGAGRGS